MQPRREVWEYGGLPLYSLCPQLDSVATLMVVHGKLFKLSQSGRDGLRVVAPADVQQVLELTTSQMELLAEVLAAVSLANLGGSGAAAPAAELGKEVIYLHELSLFLLAQLFAKEAQRPDAVEYWPDPNSLSTSGTSGFGAGQDALMSPTRRSPSAGRSLLRQQLQGHLRGQLLALRGFGDYLRRQLRHALELVLDVWPATEAATVSGPELDRLSFLIGPGRMGDAGDRPLRSSLTSLGPGPQPLDAVAAHIRGMWSEESVDSPRMLALSTSSTSSPSPKFNRAMGMVAPSGQVDDSAIAGVYRGTVVRGEADLPGGEVRITDCHDSMIYILAPIQAALVSGCSDCTFVLGAVGRIVRVERCDKVQVIAATNRLLVSSCHECSFNVGVPRPPCLFGDNRFLRLGPYSTRYEKQVAHAREVGLVSDQPSRFDQPIVLAGKDRKGHSSGPDSPRSFNLSAHAPLKACFTLQPPEELLPFVVPFVGGPGPLAGGSAPTHTTRWNQISAAAARGGAPPYLFPLPPDYERALQRKLNMTHEMRAKFKQAGLTKDKERELNDAIQGYFKEWLVSSNMLRQIYDLSTLEKEELAAQAAAAAVAEQRAAAAAEQRAAAAAAASGMQKL